MDIIITTAFQCRALVKVGSEMVFYEYLFMDLSKITKNDKKNKNKKKVQENDIFFLNNNNLLQNYVFNIKCINFKIKLLILLCMFG